MKEHIWAKNLLFIGLMLVGFGSLAVMLMAKDRIEKPESFKPNSQFFREVALSTDQVDQEFAAKLDSEQLTSAERANDLLIARRLSLGLSGTIPSLEEIREFENQPAEHRIDWWVSRLLEDNRTHDFFAERVARALVGVEDGPFLIFRRRRFVDWLSKAFAENQRYDRLVRNILTEEGLWTDTPAVNFFTRAITEDNESRPDPILLAGRTSRAFLGMRIDCLQCHDDFLGTINLGDVADLRGGMQRDFHSLAAFFAEMENSLLGIRDSQQQGPYEYRLLDEDEESVIEPAVPFMQELDGQESNLRQRLANWVTHKENKQFARAAVNRVWAIMVGRPLIEPVDDIPLDGPFPPALTQLANDFVEHDFDLHRLIRVIANSEAFQRQSHGEFEIADSHLEHGAVFPMMQLRPDQVAGALIQSTQLGTIDSTSHIITQLTKFGQQNDFVTRFGDPGEDEFEDKGETVTQRLLMLNGNMIQERLTNGFNTPVKLNGISPGIEKTIETVYLAVLTRRPIEAEIAHFKADYNSAKSRRQRQSKVVDLYWTLINSAEFRWNH